jgi:predicted neuraminidase
MKRTMRLLIAVATLTAAFGGLGQGTGTAAEPDRPTGPGIVASEFIVEKPRLASCHASTIVETPEGLVAAWFAGTREGAPDVGIWLSRHSPEGWSEPEEVATGIDIKKDRRYPCWNPVLWMRPGGELLLFYKVGPNPASWWGMVRSSLDNGKSWVKARRLPSGFIGPVRNKPVELAGGTLLCGASFEDAGWRVRMEWTQDPFGLWSRGPDLNAAYTLAAIQPTFIKHGDWTYQILCRSKQGHIVESWTTNNAVSWSPMRRTSLPNPNSAIDGLSLEDGRSVLVYNHATVGRGNLNVAVSRDGVNWQAACQLEKEADSEFSYPAVIQTQDGMVHVTYTWKREKIRHVTLNPAQFQVRDIVEGRWP